MIHTLNMKILKISNNGFYPWSLRMSGIREYHIKHCIIKNHWSEMERA